MYNITENYLLNINQSNFESIAISLYKYQVKNTKILEKYLQNLKIDVHDVKKIEDIVCFPISFFKFHKLNISQNFEHYFQSSGTSNSIRSKHYVSDLELYKYNSIQIFEKKFGALDTYVLIAVLPSYRENPHSSLIYMIDFLIKETKNELSGYYSCEEAHLIQQKISLAEQLGKKVLLWGVTYALIRLAVDNSWDAYNNLMVLETGGMKGRGEELTKEQLHHILSINFKVDKVYSEYGMTEMLSQAYSDGYGVFTLPNTMKIWTRDINDPFSKKDFNQIGAINIIDLANKDTCAFIESEDLGKLLTDNTFEILGRVDNSELRGCNMLG